MSFFIRKSLTSGPIRLNLSKGGLGISAGVTGARIGLNKHGAYVAGGRHGFYYRERLKSRRKAGASKPKKQTIELFKDTGLTFTSPADTAPAEDASNPEKKLSLNIWVKIAAGITLIAGILNVSFVMILLSAILLAGGYIQRDRRMKDGEKAIEETMEKLESLSESESPYHVLTELRKTDIPPPYLRERDERLGEAAALLFIDAHPEFGENQLHEVLDQLELSDNEKKAILTQAFDELLENCLADHMISEEEEQLLREKAAGLRLPDDALEAQLRQIAQFTSLRKQLASDTKPVSCPVRLTRGEHCYFKTPARLLKKKIIDRFQRDGVKYSVSGYDSDLEGTLYLTNKQIYIDHEDGIRNIRLSHIMDVTCSMEDDTVHLSLRNRVNPILLAVRDAVVLSAHIQRFIEDPE